MFFSHYFSVDPLALPENSLALRKALQTKPKLLQKLNYSPAIFRLVIFLYGGFVSVETMENTTTLHNVTFDAERIHRDSRLTPLIVQALQDKDVNWLIAELKILTKS